MLGSAPGPYTTWVDVNGRRRAGCPDRRSRTSEGTNNPQQKFRRSRELLAPPAPVAPATHGFRLQFPLLTGRPCHGEIGEVHIPRDLTEAVIAKLATR
jgi:hypothetical protein